jgi:hypothetical protein
MHPLIRPGRRGTGRIESANEKGHVTGESELFNN